MTTVSCQKKRQLVRVGTCTNQVRSVLVSLLLRTYSQPRKGIIKSSASRGFNIIYFNFNYLYHTFHNCYILSFGVDKCVKLKLRHKQNVFIQQLSRENINNIK